MKFPSRPWPIHPAYRRRSITIVVVLMVVGIVAVVGGLIGFYHSARLISREQKIWDTGIEPRACKVSAKQKSRKAVYYSYELNVDWTDAEGHPHTNRQSYSTAFKTIEENPEGIVKLPTPPGLLYMPGEGGEMKPVAKEPSPVRYDPDDLSRVAWRPAVEAASGQWYSAGGALVIFLFLGAALLYAGRKRWKLYPAVVKGSISGKPASVKIVKVEERRQKFRVVGQEYTLEHPVTGKSFDHTFSVKEKPMFSQGGSHLTGIIIEGEANPLILLEDGYPYVLGPPRS